MPYRRIDIPQVGRRYRMSADVEVVGGEYKGAVNTRYVDHPGVYRTQPINHVEWEDLGPALEDGGLYVDMDCRLWRWTKVGGWSIRPTNILGGPREPEFPVRAVELKEDLIRE